MKGYTTDFHESPWYSGPMKLESPGYSGPMKHKSPAHLWISGIFRPGPTKHKLYICEHLWPMSRKSQRFLGLWRTNHLYICKSQGYSGPESPVYLQISWIFANLIYIQGLKGHESPGYSCITWKSWISWIISNLLDNLECPGYSRSMNCKSTGYSQLIKNKSPGYSGPMKFESYGSLQISLTFGGLRLNLMDIPDLWSANLLNIWGLWSANLLDIWAIWSTISLIFGTYEGRISWIFVNLLDIHESLEYLGPMKHKSPGYLGHMKHASPGCSRNSWIFRAYEVLDVLGLYNKM